MFLIFSSAFIFFVSWIHRTVLFFISLSKDKNRVGLTNGERVCSPMLSHFRLIVAPSSSLQRWERSLHEPHPRGALHGPDGRGHGHVGLSERQRQHAPGLLPNDGALPPGPAAAATAGRVLSAAPTVKPNLPSEII